MSDAELERLAIGRRRQRTSGYRTLPFAIEWGGTLRPRHPSTRSRPTCSTGPGRLASAGTIRPDREICAQISLWRSRDSASQPELERRREAAVHRGPAAVDVQARAGDEAGGVRGQ